MRDRLAVIREFETENFKVIVEALPEYDPDLPFDETGDTARDIDRGALVLFCAHAYVIHKPSGYTLADDYLGNCIYKSYSEFMDHKECGVQNREYEARGESGRCGSYFAGMVKEVCQRARVQLETLKDVKVRGA